MRKTCYLTVVIIFLISGIAQAGNIIVEPEEYPLDLIAGDTVTQPINITWTGEGAVVGFIITEIKPDGEGITVTYSDDTLILFPNQKQKVDMNIVTAINLKPDTYTLTTKVYTDIEEIVKYKEQVVYREIIKYKEIENLTRINILLTMIEQLNEELNQTTGNITDPQVLQLLDGINNAIDDLIDVMPGMIITEKEQVDLLPLWIALIIIFLVLLSLITVISKMTRRRFEEIEEASDEQKPEKV